MEDREDEARIDSPTIVVLPTYNERGTIEELATEILGVSGTVEIVVVDDNSPDGTGALADRIARQTPRVSVVHRAAKLGLGSAYVEGFRFALQRGAARVVTMDADYSHHPRYLNAVIAATETSDIGIGSRYVQGGAVAADWGWRRRFLSRWANAFTRRALGFAIRDCTSGFRCYTRGVLESVDWGRIRSNGYSFLIEALHVARSHGFTFKEVPILFENRSRGRSKIGIGEVFKAMYTVVRLHGLSSPPKPASADRRVVRER